MTKELYSIGTALVTKDLWKAALLDKIGFSVNYFCPYNQDWRFGGKTETDFPIVGYIHRPLGTTYQDLAREVKKWRIIVTDDNQELLSPIPLVGDYICKNQARVVERTYNGLRLPFIGGWDEAVVLPYSVIVSRKTGKVVFNNNLKATKGK